MSTPNGYFSAAKLLYFVSFVKAGRVLHGGYLELKLKNSPPPLSTVYRHSENVYYNNEIRIIKLAILTLSRWLSSCGWSSALCHGFDD